MDILPGFNKTTVYGAHSYLKDCPVTDPENPTGGLKEGFEDSELNQSKSKPSVLKIDIVGWIGTAVLVGILGVGLFIATLARNKAIWTRFDDKGLLASDADKTPGNAISGLFLSAPPKKSGSGPSIGDANK